jgi:hypothetical protein
MNKETFEIEVYRDNEMYSDIMEIDVKTLKPVGYRKYDLVVDDKAKLVKEYVIDPETCCASKIIHGYPCQKIRKDGTAYDRPMTEALDIPTTDFEKQMAEEERKSYEELSHNPRNVKVTAYVYLGGVSYLIDSLMVELAPESLKLAKCTQFYSGYRIVKYDRTHNPHNGVAIEENDYHEDGTLMSHMEFNHFTGKKRKHSLYEINAEYDADGKIIKGFDINNFI